MNGLGWSELLIETALVERDGILVAVVKHAQIDAHAFTMLGVDTTCLEVQTLIGHGLAKECYLMTIIALLSKHKIRLLGMVFCFNLTGNTIQGLTELPSFLNDQSFSNVCVTVPAQTSTQEFPHSAENSEISKRIQQGWKYITFDGSRDSVLKVILSVVQPEQSLTFQMKLIDEKACLSVAGGWSSWICDAALGFRGTSFDEDIFWDFESSMNGATSKLLNQDINSLGMLAKELLGEARSANENSTDAIRNVAVTALHFNDLLATRRAVFKGGLVYRESGAVAYKPAAPKETEHSITVVTPPSEPSKRRSATVLAQYPTDLSVVGRISNETDHVYDTSHEKTSRTPPRVPSRLISPRLIADSSKNVTLDRKTSDITGASELYFPLKDSQIRLVNLLAGHESEKTIRLSLAVVDLVALPQFEALSYVVGQRDVSKSVGIAHRGVVTQFSISRTLETVLMTLRREDRDRLLWIDAVSINQHDPAEWSAQIKKMGQIFHAASNVCIWLGPASTEEQSDDAIEFIPKVLDFTTLDLTLKDKANKTRWLALSRLMARD